MRLTSCILLTTFVLAATPAWAASCQKWAATVEEEEEGPTLTAHVCATADPDATLNLSCGDAGQLRLVLVTEVGDDFPPDGNMEFKARFEFSAGSDRQTLTLHYEAMDGIMAGEVDRKGAIVAMLKGKTPVRLVDTTGHLGPLDFAVTGADKAIVRLDKSCR